MLTSSMLHLIFLAPFCFGSAVVWFTAGKTVVAKDEVVEEMDVMDQLKEVLEFPRLQNSYASVSSHPVKGVLTLRRFHYLGRT